MSFGRLLYCCYNVRFWIDIITNFEKQSLSNDIKAYWNQFLVIRNNTEGIITSSSSQHKGNPTIFTLNSPKKIYSEAEQLINKDIQ